MRFSVVVPAHNEEALLPRGLDSIAAAAAQHGGEVEVIVVANRCTDATAAIARAAGTVVVDSDARNIAAVRNAGAAAATGDVIVTIDADSRMSSRALEDIERLLASGRYVGGGTKVVPERLSPGIRATIGIVDAITLVTGLSGGMFWCRRSDFEAIGGFDERQLLAEDIDFARRLRAHGRTQGQRLTVLRTAPMISSVRKFDRFGDWHMFAMAFQLRQIRAVVKGTDTRWVDRYFFDFND
jgi:glycosyltransferase involved in cell wall biosynthesis